MMNFNQEPLLKTALNNLKLKKAELQEKPKKVLVTKEIIDV
jgi:hypothetical protein